ncbi:50S ribosomal protein L4 [Candidatus Endowatersipora endosymbiont of Watersipora subatra]|uniref:50S ribosomal protein L4 n=1 Tax=Candidatus Endowatersipora endosymbiont of Watersipora subatra TaxID=3077946 RepID=UPI00312C75C8
MDIDVKSLDGKKSGQMSISDSIFGLEPRLDIIQRMIRYQRAKKRQGTHQSKGRSDIKCTGSRLYRQKGTGKARHHARSAPQFRGGGKAHGPNSRDHAHSLTKKFRSLALRHALSGKVKEETLVIIDHFTAESPKTSLLWNQFGRLGIMNALMIGHSQLDHNFKLAVRNIPNIDVLPIQGINVYDLLRRRTLVLSKAAIEVLEERFK